jgi:pimeloyl-ACP methyl ester carboxylesterase
MNWSQRLALSYIRTKFKFLSAISKKKAARAAFRLFCTPQSRDTKELTGIFATAELLNIKMGKDIVAGYRWNKGDRRKVLILHGFESTALNFASYIEPLIKKDYEVLAFDAPAHGRSTGRQITALVYRDLIKYVHENLGPVKSYMGHSLGGFALSLALAEIPHDESYRAAFIAPSTDTTTAITNFFGLVRLPQNVHKEFEAHIQMLSGRPISWFSINRTLKDIRAQLLWVHDEDDNITPLADVLKVRTETYSNVRLIITKGLGHSRIYRDAEIGRTIVEFL